MEVPHRAEEVDAISVHRRRTARPRRVTDAVQAGVFEFPCLLTRRRIETEETFGAFNFGSRARARCESSGQCVFASHRICFPNAYRPLYQQSLE